MRKRPEPSWWWWWVLPIAGSLVVLAISVFSGVQARRSSELILKGESWAVIESLRGVAPGGSLQEPLARSGARWMAFVQRDGGLLAEAGQRPLGWEEAVQLRPGMVRSLHGLGCAMSPPLPPLPPPGSDGPPPPPGDDGPPPQARGGGRPLLVCFEPALSRQLERATLALFVAGLLGLIGVAGLTLVAQRLMRARDEALAHLERDRHLASLGNMAAVMAHEIRNPLASLKGHAQLLLEAAGGRPADAAMARHVVEGAQRLETLSTSLLDLARAGSLERAEVRVRPLLEAVASRDPRVKVEVRREVTCSLDPLRVTQVLTNLVDNALQASGDAEVTLSLDEQAAGVIIEVGDRGPGVPVAERARIFEPFVTTRASGTGLGLPIARRLVALHGGTLELVDVPLGALFRIVLPRGA
jgi:two-component system sensor histidine kinase HydH